MAEYNVVIFGVKETTKIIIEYLHNTGIKIDLIISINPSVILNNNIANYYDLGPIAKMIGAEYYCVEHYSLKKLSDNFFQKNHFNLGIVYGWQRLIPFDIIKKFKHGVFGFHASPDLLPKGRGRSPLNWGIILGKTVLYNHCFRYAKEADAGDIYSITPFEIHPHDTIQTLLYKSLIIAKQDLIHLIHDIKHNELKLSLQKGESYFFPKRTPDDGLIHFEYSSTREIINLIRGITHPFSGAFCFTVQNTKITIWEAWEFDTIIDFSDYKAGEVIDNLYGTPIIKTIDSSIILKNYEGCTLMLNDQLQPCVNSP